MSWAKKASNLRQIGVFGIFLNSNWTTVTLAYILSSVAVLWPKHLGHIMVCYPFTRLFLLWPTTSENLAGIQKKKKKTHFYDKIRKNKLPIVLYFQPLDLY